MSDADYERGQTDARLDISDERHQENIKRFDKIEATLDDLVSTISVVKGGARMLFAVGSVSAAIGAFFSTAFRYLEAHWK